LIRIFLSFLGVFLITATALAEYSLVTDDAETAGKGKVQVESGVSFYYDKASEDNTTVKTENWETSIGVTVGLRDNLDVVLRLPYLWMSVAENGGPAERADGMGDALLDVKWRFLEKDGWGLALRPGVRLPSGNENKGLGQGRTGYRLFFIASREFGPVEIDFNLGYIRNENVRHDREDIWLASMAVEYEITKAFELLFEIGIERNPVANSINHPAFVSGGLAYEISETVTVDASVAFGLTDPQVDTLYMLGITFSF